MLKMLLVDDEVMIREGLSTTIDWEQHEIKVIGAAANGIEALALIEKEKPDVVVTDVMMPEMNGLALAEYIVDTYPEIDIIMFSGFDEFEYARQGIRLGVKDYLLKPIDIDELIQLLIDIKKSKNILEHSKEKDSFQLALFPYLFKDRSAKKENEGNVVTDEYFYRVVVCEIFDFNHYRKHSPYNSNIKDKEQWEEQLVHLIRPDLDGFLTVFTHENELVTVLIDADEQKLSTSFLQKFFEKINRNIKTNFFLSSVRKNRENLYEMKEEALAVRESSTGLEPQFRTSEHYKMIDETGITYAKAAERDLKKAVIQQQREDIKDIVCSVFSKWREEQQSLKNMLRMSRELEFLVKNNILETMPNQASTNFLLLLQEEIDLRIYNSLESIQDLLIEDFNNLSESINKENNYNWIIKQVLQFIQTNYQLDIQARKIAEEHFITPNYFSMLFKQETGMSFSDYLNTVRVNKASSLLIETSNRVFEIAEFVGYREYKYFVKVFKKYKGVTPTHFRNMHG
ncbi:response regulator [Sinobaca sp. H24]|uniref:response regulator n=1 Tax=Sinobaca sp. H24 TaxID=2923376 RepID=UPI00207A757F|nr:response regulator [Sinobaca sp. H24]